MNRQQRRTQGCSQSELMAAILQALAKNPDDLPTTVKRLVTPQQWDRIRGLVFKLHDEWLAQTQLGSIAIIEGDDQHDPNSIRPGSIPSLGI